MDSKKKHWDKLKERIRDNPTLGTNITSDKKPLREMSGPLNKISKIFFYYQNIETLKRKILVCLRIMIKSNNLFNKKQLEIEDNFRDIDTDYYEGSVDEEDLDRLFNWFSGEHEEEIERVKKNNISQINNLTKLLDKVHNNYIKLVELFIKDNNLKKAIKYLVDYKNLLNSTLSQIPKFQIKEVREADTSFEKSDYVYDLRSEILKSSGIDSTELGSAMNIFLNNLIKFILKLSNLSIDSKIKLKLVKQKIKTLSISIPVPIYLCKECHTNKLLPKNIVKLIKKYKNRLIGDDFVDGIFDDMDDDMYIMYSLIDYLIDIGRFRSRGVNLFFNEIANPSTSDKTKEGWELWSINNNIPLDIFEIDSNSPRNLWVYLNRLDKDLVSTQ